MSQITDVTTLHVDPSDDAAMPDILATANNVRAERATDMYEHSSRSHSIFTLHIDCVRGPEAHPFQMATSTECLVLQHSGELIRVSRKGRFRWPHLPIGPDVGELMQRVARLFGYSARASSLP